MKNLIKYKEFLDSQSETSTYEPPEHVIAPAENDKIWNYAKKELENGALWGFDLANQEESNKIITNRK